MGEGVPVAVVGAGPFGLSVAAHLRSRGARVAICARHKDILESAAKEIGALAGSSVRYRRQILSLKRDIVNSYTSVIRDAGRMPFERFVQAYDALVEKAVQAILGAARTGKIGDGKIFLSRVDEAIRIRNDERGEGAL